MTGPIHPNDPRRRRSISAGLIALLAFGVALAAWFWMTGQPPEAASGLPLGIFVTAAAASVAALMAQLRGMTAWDILVAAVELITSTVAGLLWLVDRFIKIAWAIILAALGCGV